MVRMMCHDGPVRISGLWIYPVKSCAGIAVASIELGERGLLHDREWMVADARGRFVSQRTHPEMALIRPVLEGDRMFLTAPGREPLEIPLEPRPGRAVAVDIWRDRCRGLSEGPAAAAWLGALLGEAVTLVRMPPEEVRPVDPRYAGPGDRVGFADGFPLLLISRASLEDLNARLDEPVGMERFRPNLEVGGCGPFAEDTWRRLEIAGVGFRLAKPCARCVITTVDPATGRRGEEPLRTLAAYRRFGNKVLFGQNLIHEGRGILQVGDVVHVMT